jgi:hypothetical protein
MGRVPRTTGATPAGGGCITGHTHAVVSFAAGGGRTGGGLTTDMAWTWCCSHFMYWIVCSSVEAWLDCK